MPAWGTSWDDSWGDSWNLSPTPASSADPDGSRVGRRVKVTDPLEVEDEEIILAFLSELLPI